MDKMNFKPKNSITNYRTFRPRYEINRWPYLLALPIMWALTLWVLMKKGALKIFRKKPHINSFWFDGLGLTCRAIKEGTASWKALDIIYNYRFRQKAGLRGFADDFWIGIINAQAVRNRLRLVKYELEKIVGEFADSKIVKLPPCLKNRNRIATKEVRILSLGSGSAQGIIELMTELKPRGIIIKAFLLDLDQSALEYAQKLARKYGVADQIEVSCTKISAVMSVAESFKPHIIEMLGLLDYIPEKKAVRLVRKIHDALPKSGVFLTCNIRHNPEQFFLGIVINWWMIYRTPKEFEGIISKGGFGTYKLIYEPLNVHGIAIARKSIG
ncbi:MAG: hypothetical protein BMS9Abin13_087 [Patescibacteria group bacterium]|nr:MAG: hypothetical protein BMS9Abin13_087 [Patescibacteria group bacterium]